MEKETSQSQPAKDDKALRSGFGKWDDAYKNLPDDAKPDTTFYADTVGLTYWMAAAFFADIPTVEDWGCGRGGFKHFYRGNYICVDGSNTPFASKVVDLCTYKSEAPGILVRHILEHNHRWQEILDSAVASFQEKMCLVLFTPFAEKTCQIGDNADYGINVPDLSFSKKDIEDRLVGLKWNLFENIVTNTQYNVEHIYFIWR